MGGAALPLLSYEDEEASEQWERDLARRGPVRDLVWRVSVWEWRNLWRLSWASVVIQLSALLLGTVSQMFAGKLGTLPLAGVSVTGMGVQSLAFGISVGMANAVQTVCGQAFGAKQYKSMGPALQRALLLHFSISILLAILCYFSGSLLISIGQKEEIAQVGQQYARGVIPHVIAIVMYTPLQRFLQAQNIVNPVAYISVSILAFHILLSYLTVSILNFGLSGVAFALSTSCCLLTLSTWLYIVYNCKETWSGFSSSEMFSGLWGYAKLAFASTVMTALEVWYVPMIALLTGYLTDPEISLDSIAICINWWNWDFMIMFGLSNAASARIGKELGAAHPKVAKYASIVVLSTTITISLIFSALILALKTPICKLFTDSSQVISKVDDLAPLLAVSLVLNGIHPILSGIAVGSGWQDIVAYVNIISYYLIGFPIAYYLGFKTSLEVTGLFWGVVIGVFVQTVVLSIITLRIDWDKEVEKAEQRLKRASIERDYL
ncbi:hypothetical protein LUZ60_010311 [Juncus effusus]|nr:hypothetical protein LUZ60_010311 [Juncus effusus]